jgi:hypothetical protein
MANNVSIEQSLQAYRVMNTPTKFSWKQHWAQETFSNNDYLMCDEYEKTQFQKRLRECGITICPRITSDDGVACTLLELVNNITNPTNKGTLKANRKVVYSSSNGMRPKGDEAYKIWDGFQVIDIDIKDETLANKLKVHIFNKLYKSNWFLGVTKSASGLGLHVYTKITVPQEDKEDIKKKKDLFRINFSHKFSFVYLACLSAAEEMGFSKTDLISWLDLHQAKPQQGAFIGYDPHPLINTFFFEDFIYVNFDNIDDIGHPGIDWVTHPDIKNILKQLNWFDDYNADLTIEVIDKPRPNIDTHEKYHYKHFERWRLANTLVKLYGKDDGYQYLRRICTNNIKDKELQADCATAASYKKPVDVWAVNRLNSHHGFKIKLNVEDSSFNEDELFHSMDTIDNPTLIRESKYLKNYHLNSDQYLGNIRYQLLEDLGRITLLEAGAGVGKTEMVKQICRDGKKIIMVMPFTSTIKAKVENDKDWYYSYGSRKPRLDVESGLSLTIDKFSHLNLMDIKAAGFDYIFIDESHLLFQSEYRPVMAKVIEMIRNTEIPIILMSGTPSGELVFFPDIVHLKVVKDDLRKKEFKVNLVNTPSDLMYHMCKKMADDIKKGRRILFPTNNGTLYSKQIKAAVTYFLQRDYLDFDEVKLHYYKKSNIGEEFMDNVNFEKTIKDIQILLCTDYLSVGVDILDRYNFSIYFVEAILPQEIEQFANRLRSNDLYINFYIAKNDAEGNTMSLHRYKPMNFKLNDEEIKNVHSILRLCNNMIERNPVEYKYNSLISSIIHDNKFIEYNEIENKYYLNEIAYKVIYFERKYREYAQQLPVIMKGMMAYGYQISSQDLPDFPFEGNEEFKDLKNMVKLAYDEQLALNTMHIEELMEIITEDRLPIYKDVLAGHYEIRKGDMWKDEAKGDKKKMTVKNIEVFEKVVPIFTSLSKQYRICDIREIFESCRNKNGTFNFAAIKRIRLLVNILYNEKHNRLDLPINEFMNKAYAFSDRKTVHKTDIKVFLTEFAQDYARQASTEEIVILRAELTMKGLIDTFEKIFKCLIKTSRPNKEGMVEMERIELLWKEREYYNQIDLNEKLFILSDFLNIMDINEENIEEC